MNIKNYLFFNKLSFAFLLLTIFLVPFFFIPYSYISLDANKGFLVYIGISLSTIFWLIACLFAGRIKIPQDRLIIFGLIIPVIFLISSYFSPFFYISFLGNGFEIGTAFSMFVFYLIFLLSSVHFQTEKKFWHLILTLFLSLSIVFIFALTNLFFDFQNTFPGLLKGIPANNLVGNWNDFAIFSGLTFLFSVYTIQLLKIEKKFLIFVYFLAFVSFFFLLILNVPSLWFLVGIFALILFVYSLYLKKINEENIEQNNKYKFPTISLVVVLLSIVILIGGSRFNDIFKDKINISNYDIRPSLTATYDIASSSLKENILLGTGPNTFSIDWALWHSREINQTIFWNVDFVNGYSFVFGVIVTVGILGFLSLFIFMIIYLTRGIQLLKISNLDDKSNYFVLTLFMFSIYGWLILLFFNPNYVLMTLTFASSGLLVGYLVYCKAITIKNIFITQNKFINIILVLILNILIFALMFVLYIYTLRYVSIIYYNNSLNFNKNDPVSLEYSEKMLNKALSLNKADIYMRALSQIYIQQLNHFVVNSNLSNQGLDSNIQKLIDLAEEKAIMAVNHNRSYYLNYVNLGNIYSSLFSLNIKNSYEGAILAYNTAFLLSPQNPEILFLRAKLEELNNNNNNLAKEYLEKALSLKPDYIEASLFIDKLNGK